MRFWKVGELAKATGLTVRTLHHYDEIGLLRPSRRSGSGYRLYAEEEIERLQRITSLRQLGFSLAEIRECLEHPDYAVERVIELHITRLGEEIDRKRMLRERLRGIVRLLDSAEGVSAEAFLDLIGVMTMHEKYYTEEQLEQLRRRAETVGEARIREVEAEWPKLIAEVRAEMEKGTDPSDARVQALARRWMALVEEFTGGDPGIAASLRKMYEQEPEARQWAGIDPALQEYVARARAAAE